MKTAKIAIILLLFCTNVYCQTDTLPAGKQSDAVWIGQLIANENKEQAAAAKQDSLSQYVEWTGGKVVYSPDSCLRIAQVSGRFPYSEKVNYTTIIQYLSSHKAIELKLSADTVNYSFNDYPISRIYKLPSPNGTYLIIASKTDTVQKATLYHDDGTPITRPAGQDSVYQKIGNVASLVHIVRDSLVETGFETREDNEKSPYSEIISGNALSADLDTYLPATKNIPKPFIKYDLVKSELSFLTLYNSDGEGGDHDGKGSPVPFLSIYSGVFKYKDSVFSLVSDTSYFYPSLESLDETVASKKFRTGNYTTKVKGTVKYQEVGEGVLGVLYVDYDVQSQKIGYVDYIDDEPVKTDFKPNYKAQKDGSLIFLITNSTTPNHSGMCGGCEYYDSEFWVIKQKKKNILFSFSSSTSTGYTTYFYNNGKSDRKGRFYLENNDDADNTEDNPDVDTYWKNNSTYVFHVTDNTLARNFYLHFVTVNKKTIVKLTVGKLQHKKRRQD